MKLAILKRIFIISVLIFISIGLYSQTLYPPKYLSPNTSSLGTFGEVPVNMFTGTPNISIPIYQLKFGDIKVPISLRYNASAVKPSLQPSWVGSGWDLESVGTITRQQRYTIDEEYIDPTVNGIGTPSNTVYYYQYPGQLQGVNPGSYYPRITTTTAQLNSLFGTPTTASPINLTGDVEADEFTFDVMGHSGKFYYEGPVSGWQVVSDEHITIQMTDFFTAQDIYNAFLEYKNNFSPVSSTAQIWTDQSRAFGSFTLTVPDGTKFVFGGRTGTGHPDAVEFTSPMPNISGNSQDQVFTANTWLLKSIIDVKGNTINFHYSRQFPTCTRYLSASGYSLQVSNNQTGLSLPCTAGCSNPVTDASFKNNLSGIFQWPMYLTQISTPNENVNFYSSPHVYNNYTQAQMSYADQTNPTLSVDLTILGVPPAWPGCLNNIKWEKLDSIVVTDTKVNGTYHYPTRLRKFQFNFINSASCRIKD